MPRTDSFGFVHPVMTDEPSLLGYIHIAECGQCHIDFPELAAGADSLVARIEADLRERLPR